MTPPAVALAFAVVTALPLARRLHAHRPIAAGLASLFVCSLTRDAVTGSERWRPLDVALFAAWQCATAALVIGPLTTWRRALPFLPAWLAFCAGALGAAPPGPSPERALWMAALWRTVYLGGLGAQVGAVALWLRSSKGRAPTPPETIALVLAASTAAELAGPWLRPHLTDAWVTTVLPSVLCWAALALIQGGASWIWPASMLRSPPPS